MGTGKVQDVSGLEVVVHPAALVQRLQPLSNLYQGLKRKALIAFMKVWPVEDVQHWQSNMVNDVARPFTEGFLQCGFCPSLL